jgi:ABC-type multidrug transport system fused ATPase/permease subunit
MSHRLAPHARNPFEVREASAITFPLTTEIDWIRKKTQGYLIQVFGIFLIVLAILLPVFLLFLGVPSGGLTTTLIVLVVAFVVIWYGNQLVAKAKHVAWTKEALREHDAKARRGADLTREYLNEESSRRDTSHEKKRFRRRCGTKIPSDSDFCKVCGTHLSEL